ncbi:uncharacterized protein LOC106134615 [Amyelois transitella]|uniref:uncharacterized protein LOC106134615 n=1 Tax=Amyelois transitella TaxID=680683 RepID=UPI00067A7A1C|nr:uncharacterized protein LOC106134615 [Amyelois transitella]
MFALHSQRLRRRLSAPTSGSARRRARERRRAEQTRQECERLARERREQRQREKLEDQRQAREEFSSYEPWGRAGGGAPNPQGIRFTNIRARGIYPEDELRGVSQVEACYRWPTLRHRRIIRRTPLRLREDPQLCYADNLRQSVDNDIRYRQTPVQQQNYKQFLDEMVDKRRKAINKAIKENLEYERKMHTMEGPWGRPGPGGTTWRNPRDIGLNFSKSMGWTDNEIFNKMSGEDKRCLRSSLTLPKVKRDDDSKENDPPVNEYLKTSVSNVDKLPDINHTNSANAKTPEDQNKSNGQEKALGQIKEVGTNIDNNKHVKSPNGRDKPKNGNGNQKGNKSPPKSKFVKRLSNGDRVRKVIPDDDYDTRAQKNDDQSIVYEKKPTPEATILGLTGGVELVPLLARRRRVGARTLPSSDVTRPPEQFCQWREMLNMDYLRELKHQMRVKSEQKEESRRDSAESVRRHHETWASLWGRPGHGAPQCRGKYARSNLAQLLYVAPLGNSR